jgi:hypothetical protein
LSTQSLSYGLSWPMRWNPAVLLLTVMGGEGCTGAERGDI